MLSIFALILLLAASFAASGILFRHQRVLTYLAAWGILFELFFLVATYIDRSLVSRLEYRSYIYGLVALAVSIFAYMHRKQWTFPYGTKGSGIKDMFVILTMIVPMLAVYLVSSVNGPQENYSWLFHGFYNGDTVTLVSLVQKSFSTSGLVAENPLAANGYLEYPTLLHGSIATLYDMLGVSFNWIYFLPIMMYLQLFLTIPIFFLVWDTAYPEPKEQARLWFGVPSRFIIFALQAVVVLFVMAISWDNYIYPQSHFFLTGLLVMQQALLVTAFTQSGKALRISLIAASLSAFVLLLSNAITGSAAVATIAIAHMLFAQNKKLLPQSRMWHMILIGVWAILFLIFSSGEASFGRPSFSTSSAYDMLRLAPVVILLVAGVAVSTLKQPYLVTATAILMAAALVTFFFSTRPIVIENASRFFYQALLIGFPIMLQPLIRLFYLARRELLYSGLSPAVKGAGWICVVAIIALVAVLPAGISVVDAHRNLMRNDPQIITQGMYEASWWIQDHTNSDDIILTSPFAPWFIPYFTGRSILRASYEDTPYWLSPEDLVYHTLRRGFTEDDPRSRALLLTQADYLVLTDTERTMWEPLSLERVFDNKATVIYKIRQ